VIHSHAGLQFRWMKSDAAATMHLSDFSRVRLRSRSENESHDPPPALLVW
jgi:hypothetical protein